MVVKCDYVLGEHYPQVSVGQTLVRFTWALTMLAVPRELLVLPRYFILLLNATLQLGH